MAAPSFTQAMGRDEAITRHAIDAPFGKALVALGAERTDIVLSLIHI